MKKVLGTVEGLRPVPAVGCVCFRGDEVLLVKRGQAPMKGHWSIPGGRIEPGETSKAAALRELKEETGVEAELVGLVDVVDAIFKNKSGDMLTRHYVLIDYAARWIEGEPVGDDDAEEARFIGLDELAAYDLRDETRRVIDAAYRKMKDKGEV